MKNINYFIFFFIMYVLLHQDALKPVPLNEFTLNLNIGHTKHYKDGQVKCQIETVATWTKIVYDFSSEEEYKKLPLENKEFIPENNILTGVKVYKKVIYVTVSRWLPGVPSALNTIIKKDGGAYLLRPYPSWKMQEIDNCAALQFPQSMEIDPKNGWMWIIDAGRRNIWDKPVTKCPPKLVIWDLNKNVEVHRYIFPHEILSWKTNFVNDIVVDPINGDWAYMTDAGIGPSGHSGGIVTYDRRNDASWRIEHKTMKNVTEQGKITILNNTLLVDIPSDGIALSSDGIDLFYCAIAGYNLYTIPTNVLQNKLPDLDKYIKLAGRKISQTDGMTFGKKNLYFGAMSKNAIYKWEASKDMDNQGKPLGNTIMETQTEICQDDEIMIWPDTFAWDENGYLYVTTNKLPFIKNGVLDWNDGPHFEVIKIKTDDSSYIAP